MIWFQILEMQRNFHKWPFTPNTLTKIRNHLTFWRIRGLLIRICTTSFTIFIWSNYDPLKIRFRGGPCVYILLCTNQITSYEIHMNLKTSSWNSDIVFQDIRSVQYRKNIQKDWSWNLKKPFKRKTKLKMEFENPFKKNTKWNAEPEKTLQKECNTRFTEHFFLIPLLLIHSVNHP